MESEMETWINRVLMVCGASSGLMLGTGSVVEASTLAAATVFVVCLMRAHANMAADE